jgi:cysteine-rich repeat protein
LNRRTLVRPLLACVAATAAVSCGPTEQAQTVAFVLSLTAERVSNIEFRVGYANGNFTELDGACVVSNAAGPRSAAAVDSALLEKDAVYGMTRKQRRLRTESIVVQGGTVSTTSTLSTSSTTHGSLTTNTAPIPSTTTTLAEAGTCGDGVLDGDEQCDDDNTTSNDGCDGNCLAEFAFSAIDDDEGELIIRITNGRGIPPGAALAFCKFQGDLETADLSVRTHSCSLPNGTLCLDPDADAPVAVSTTTTTTTTTTSTVSTTSTLDGNTSTTSSTVEDN